MTDEQARDLSNRVLADWQTALYQAVLFVTKWRQLAVEGDYPSISEVSEQTGNLAVFLCAGLAIEKALKERAFQ